MWMRHEREKGKEHISMQKRSLYALTCFCLTCFCHFYAFIIIIYLFRQHLGIIWMICLLIFWFIATSLSLLIFMKFSIFIINLLNWLLLSFKVITFNIAWPKSLPYSYKESSCEGVHVTSMHHHNHNFSNFKTKFSSCSKLTKLFYYYFIYLFHSIVIF